MSPGSVPLGQRQLDAADEVRAHVVDERAQRRECGHENDVDRAQQTGRADDTLRRDLEAAAALGTAGGGEEVAAAAGRPRDTAASSASVRAS